MCVCVNEWRRSRMMSHFGRFDGCRRCSQFKWAWERSMVPWCPPLCVILPNTYLPLCPKHGSHSFFSLTLPKTPLSLTAQVWWSLSLSLSLFDPPKDSPLPYGPTSPWLTPRLVLPGHQAQRTLCWTPSQTSFLFYAPVQTHTHTHTIRWKRHNIALPIRVPRSFLLSFSPPHSTCKYSNGREFALEHLKHRRKAHIHVHVLRSRNFWWHG